MQFLRPTGRSFLARWGDAPLATHLCIVFAIAVLLRTLLFVVSSAEPVSRQLKEDSYGLITLASNMADGQGYGRVRRGDTPEAGETWRPELTRPPGYPVFLRLFGAREGQAVPGAVAAQHLLAIGVCVFATIASRRTFGSRAGLAAGVLLAADVHGASLSNLVLTEGPFASMVFFAALLTVRIFARPSGGKAAGVGLLLAVATMVKPTTIALCSILAVAMFAVSLRRRDWRLAFAGLVVVVVGNAPVAAWTTRNGVVAGEYTFSSIPRYQLLAEHAAGAVARSRDIAIDPVRDELFDAVGISGVRVRYAPLSPEESSLLRSFALTTIRRHFKGFVVESAIRSANMLFGPDKNVLCVVGLPPVTFGVIKQVKATPTTAPLGSWLLLGIEVVSILVLYGLLLLAAIRLWPWRKVTPLVPVALAFAFYVIVLSLGTPGDPRYRWPAVPLLTLIAAGALSPRTSPVRSDRVT